MPHNRRLPGRLNGPFGSNQARVEKLSGPRGVFVAQPNRGASERDRAPGFLPAYLAAVRKLARVLGFFRVGARLAAQPADATDAEAAT